MVAQRVWEDGTYGTLSSDGRYVFSIEDLGLEAEPQRQSGASWSYRRSLGMRAAAGAGNHGPCNRLAARDLHQRQTGVADRRGRRRRHPLAQAGIIFLGPPLPLRGQLYVLAEVNDEIRLLALDADTGDTLWSQQLAVVAAQLLSRLRCGGRRDCRLPMPTAS